MRARINTKQFLTELRAVRAFQGKHNIISIRAAGDRVHLTGTCYGAKMSTSVPATVVSEGAFSFDRSRFAPVIALLQGEDFGLSVEGGDHAKLIVEDDSYEAKFPAAYDAFSFADPTIPATCSCELPGVMLADMLDASSFAMPTDDAMKEQLGLLIEGEEGVTRIVVTNGHCLALIEEPVGSRFVATMPRRVAAQLATVLADNPTQVKLSRYDHVLEVVAGDRRMLTALQAMNFPDYRRIIPKAAQTVVKLRAADVLKAAKRIAASAEDLESVVSLHVGNGFTLSNDDAKEDVGLSRQSVEGPECSLTVALGYFMRGLEACGDVATLRINGPKDPMTISPEDGRRTFLVAPRMRR